MLEVRKRCTARRYFGSSKSQQSKIGGQRDLKVFGENAGWPSSENFTTLPSPPAGSVCRQIVFIMQGSKGSHRHNRLADVLPQHEIQHRTGSLPYGHSSFFPLKVEIQLGEQTKYVSNKKARIANLALATRWRQPYPIVEAAGSSVCDVPATLQSMEDVCIRCIKRRT
jgi:hypothetical protein